MHSLPTESLWSRATSGLPVLTRTTGQTRVSLQGELEVIQEVDYLYSPNESTIDEHSTFIPSVGELASSVIIPHQKRDKNSSETDLNRHHLRQTASLDNLGDGLLSDFGISDNHQPGVLNPIVTELNENMSLSEHGSELESIEKGFQVCLFIAFRKHDPLPVSPVTHPLSVARACTHHTHTHTHTHVYVGRTSLFQPSLPN